jgi:adenosylhomocysteine nucleosidase
MSGNGATSSRAGGAPARTPAPPPLAADVGIVAALPIEVGFLLDRLGRVRKYAGPRATVIEGEHEGKIIAVIVGGAGRLAARRAGELLLDGHRPRWVVSAGFAGALDPALRRNDTVLATEVVDPEGRCFAVETQMAFTTTGRGPRIVPGRLVTGDAIVRTAADKAGLRTRTGGDVVDMESSAVAALCAERAARFVSVRVVSDEAAVDLPGEVVSLMNRSGSNLVGAALRAVWNRPSSLKDLLTLHHQAHEAADRLAEVILAAVAALPV